MPDDERLGGTRDPHGSRHRRADNPPPPPQEDQPRRRRRSVESGGVSVADLVQRHTGSRPDLTPVNPDQLRQNGVATPGRRARRDEPPAPPPPPPVPPRQATAHPSIAAALDGADGFPPDRAAPHHGGGNQGDNGFPRDEGTHRPGGASSYFTIPSDALRSSYDASDEAGYAAPDEPPARGYAAPDQPPARGYAAPDEPPARRGHRRADEAPGSHRPRTDEGFPLDGGAPHDGYGPGEIPRLGPDGFGPDGAPPRRTGTRRAGEGSGPRNGFPPDGTGRRRNGSRQVGEGSGPRNGSRQVGEGSGPRNGFPPEGDAPRPGPRRPGEGSGPRNGFNPEGDLPRSGRRPGEASTHMPLPGDNGFGLGEDPRNGFGPDGDLPRPGRRPGEGSAHLPGPGDNGFMPGEDPRNGFGPESDLPRPGRRPGEASTHMPPPGDNGFAPDPNGFPSDGGLPRPGRRPGEASTHLPGPGDNGFAPDHNGFAPDGGLPRPGRRPGEASTHLPGPGDNGFAPDRNGFTPDGDLPRPGRRPGEASTHMPPPGDNAFGLGEDPRNGFGPDVDRSGRRPGEASTHLPSPGRRAGETSGRRSVNDGDNGFPLDGGAPRPNRRVGEASVRMPIAEGFPSGRRSGEGPRGGFGPGDENGFPPDPDAPRPNRRVGEASIRMPVDGFPPDAGAPRRDRRGRRFPPSGGRPGEAPGDGGFPPETGRPEGAARRRAARVSEPGARFPADTPPQPQPQPGHASGLFPVDEFHRQGPPDDEMGELDEPQPRRKTGVPAVPLPPPPMGDDDLISMTTEMEAIGDEVQKRRSIDHTLARFSAVHDEIKAEEREKKAKRRKMRPWERPDEEMDRLDELEAQQSMAMVIPNVEPRDDDYDDEDDDPKKAKKKKRWRKGKNTGKAFAVFFAGLIFLSTAVLWGFKSYIENSAMQVAALDPDSDAIKDAAAQLGDENFLLVGSDTRAGATAEDGVGDDQEVQGARSDTVMIAHVPKNRERVVVVSFPRDLEVTRPACEGWDPKTGKYTGQQHPEVKRVKLNTAYQTGGPMCVTKLIQNLSGLAINHFVGIDFHGFKDMVDAVAGVEVCVERPMKDDVLGMVVPEAGKNVKLTGDQALNFVRARHVIGDPTSDYGRITRQQRFLSSLLRKAMSGEVLLNPGKLTKFVDAFSKATFGDNIGIDQLFTLGQSMQGVEAGRVTFITVPTVGIENERHNEDLRPDDSNALFEAIRQGVPLPDEAPEQDDASNKGQTDAQRSGLTQQQGQPQGPVDPKGIKLQVLNGGNETGGIAGDTADQLADLGFEIMRVDAGPPTDKTVIKYGKSRAAQAQTLHAAVPGATLVEDASVGGSIILVIGPEYDGEVVSPDGGGPPVDVPDNLSTVNAGDVSCA